jgi:hypothetical protein
MAIKKGRKTRKNKSISGGTTPEGYFTYEDIMYTELGELAGQQFIRVLQNCPRENANCNDKCIVIKIEVNRRKYYLTYAKTSNPDDYRYALIEITENGPLKGFPLKTEFGEPDNNGDFLTFFMKKDTEENITANEQSAAPYEYEERHSTTIPPANSDPLGLDGNFILFDLKGTYKCLVYAEKEKFSVEKIYLVYDYSGNQKPTIQFKRFSSCDDTQYPTYDEKECNKIFQIKNEKPVKIEKGYFHDLNLVYDNDKGKNIIDKDQSFIIYTSSDEDDRRYGLKNIEILTRDQIEKKFFETRHAEYVKFLKILNEKPVRLSNLTTEERAERDKAIEEFEKNHQQKKRRGGKRNTRLKKSKTKRRKATRKTKNN